MWQLSWMAMAVGPRVVHIPEYGAIFVGPVRFPNIVEEASNELGLKSLTLYAFSTENWSRPLFEVRHLIILLKKFLLKEKRRIISNQICFRVIGDISTLHNSTKKLIREMEEETKDFDGLKLTFAFDYGGRTEILTAINSFIKKNPGKTMSKECLKEHLFIPEIENVDLLIRTGGEQRISNFLLWQIAYAELYFSKILWPDFKRSEFRQIIEEVSNRERRFGHTNSTVCLAETISQAEKNKSNFVGQQRKDHY